jgi:hypothetical protein
LAFHFPVQVTVADTGMTELQLAAHAKPVNPHTSLFNVRYDSSICQVQIAILDTLSNVATTITDLFPLENMFGVMMISILPTRL